VVGLELSVDVVVAVLDDMSFVLASGLLFLSGRSYFISRCFEEGEGEGERVNRKDRG